MSSSDTLAFDSICNFVKTLSESYGEDHYPIKLYEYLLEKTTPDHTKVIQKHLNVFRSFCEKNKDALENLDKLLLNPDQITYSEKVYIDIGSILTECDSQTENTIWEHLLTIFCLLDTTNTNLKDVVRKLKNKEIVPKGRTPQRASGNNGGGGGGGGLDLGQLIGSISGLTQNMSTDEQSAPMVNLLNGVLGNLGKVLTQDNNSADSTNDLMGMLGTLVSSMQTMTNPQQSSQLQAFAPQITETRPQLTETSSELNRVEEIDK